jgi:hypothetical protein
MKNLLFTTSLSFGLLATAGATVTWDISIGALRSSSGTQVPAGSLWAMIYQDGAGNLPGGLDSNSSLTTADTASIGSAFAGMTISQGLTIGGSTIILTGSVDSAGSANYGIVAATFPPFAGVTAGGLWGLYWFPGLTPASNVVPVSDFEVGGFTQADATVEPYGNTGTIIPSDGASATTYFFDSETTTNPGDLPVARFTAVAVPEPATLTLSVLGLAALLRRRRR